MYAFFPRFSFAHHCFWIEVYSRKSEESFTINKINIGKKVDGKKRQRERKKTAMFYRGEAAVGDIGDGMTFEVVISSGNWLVIHVKPEKIFKTFVWENIRQVHIPHFKLVNMYFNAFVHCSWELLWRLAEKRNDEIDDLNWRITWHWIDSHYYR